MKDRWRKIRQEDRGDEVEIIYQNEAYPGVLIMSCRHRVKNFSPRGFWEHTSFLVKYAGDSKEFWRLKEAKEYVAKGGHHENHH